MATSVLELMLVVIYFLTLMSTRLAMMEIGASIDVHGVSISGGVSWLLHS